MMMLKKKHNIHIDLNPDIWKPWLDLVTKYKGNNPAVYFYNNTELRYWTSMSVELYEEYFSRIKRFSEFNNVTIYDTIMENFYDRHN